MDQLYNKIPVLDLHDFNSDDEQKKKAFVNALGAAYNDIGFVAIKNHGLSDQLCDNLYENVQRFF